MNKIIIFILVILILHEKVCASANYDFTDSVVVILGADDLEKSNHYKVTRNESELEFKIRCDYPKVTLFHDETHLIADYASGEIEEFHRSHHYRMDDARCSVNMNGDDLSFIDYYTIISQGREGYIPYTEWFPALLYFPLNGYFLEPRKEEYHDIDEVYGYPSGVVPLRKREVSYQLVNGNRYNVNCDVCENSDFMCDFLDNFYFVKYTRTHSVWASKQIAIAIIILK